MSRAAHLAAKRSLYTLITVVTLLVLFLPSAAAQSAKTQSSAKGTPAKSIHVPVIILNSAVTILESPNAPKPIQKAAEDLASDFQKVMGKKPKIVTSPSDAGPVTILIEEQAKIPEAMRNAELKDPESFSISTTTANWNNKPSKVILLTGPDLRGTMYAVYEFSQEFLGIDPLYYWTDKEPARRASVEIPASLNKQFPAPLFKYRGFFINDEDLLTGWAPGEKKDKTGISLAVWDKIYETTLRLKGNIVTPGTWIFPDDPQVKLAATRGLIISQHHAIPLGLNVARWPEDVPYNYTTHPEILERAWKDAVNSYRPNQEVLWTVGLRGLSDASYASRDESVRNNDKALGALITKAIADQISIVRAVHPDAKFITSLWQEGARLVQEGYLKIPPEVTTVWADSGYGYIEDKGEVTKGQGIYDHVAMMNGRANQLTEMVPIERSFSELQRYIKAGATEYFLVNTSDIRPVSMSIRAVMDAVWKGLPTEGEQATTAAQTDLKQADVDQAKDKFYQEWSSQEFGEKAAPKITQIYKDYFKAPAHFGEPPLEYGDQLYHTEARRMMLTYMTDWPLYGIPSQSPKWSPVRAFGVGGFGGSNARRFVGKEWLTEATAHEIQQCGDAQPRWDAVWKEALAAEPLVATSRKPFYQSEVLTMIAINRESNRALYLISQAIQNAQQGKIAEAHAQTEDALKALAEVQQAQSAAEYGKWKNWYRGDWLTGVYRTRQMAETFANFLNDPLTHIDPPILWDGWEAYYHIMHYEGDRSADVK
jgi:hypothetical protein